jgi:hypothetical protein
MAKSLAKDAKAQAAREKDARAQYAKGKNAKAARKAAGSSKMLIALPLLAGAAVVALPSLIVLAVGIVPTLAARITDITPGRYATRCVGALNLAGIAPFLRNLWAGDNTLPAALHMISDPYTWLIAYGAAAIGWLLFMSVPNAVAMFKSIENEIMIKRLRARQEELVAEWGPGIVTRARDGARRGR